MLLPEYTLYPLEPSEPEDRLDDRALPDERLEDRPDRTLPDEPLDREELRVVLRPVDEPDELRLRVVLRLPDEDDELRVVLRPLEVPDELRVVLRVVLRVPEEVRPDEVRSTPLLRVELDERPTVLRGVRPVVRLVTPAPRVRSTLRLAEPVAAAPPRTTVRVRPSLKLSVPRVPVPTRPPRVRLALATPPRPMVLPRGPYRLDRRTVPA